MKHTLSTAILTIFLAGSALASESQSIENAQQLNSLPTKVQARVHVMMGAKKVETRIKPDGTTAEVYQEPPLSDAHVAAIQSDYSKKLNANTAPTKDHSVPLAEAAMAAPRGQTLPLHPRDKLLNMKIIKYSISTLGDLKSAPFQQQNVDMVRLYIPDALDFITHFDQYLPYLKKVQIMHISFTDAQEKDPHFLDLLRAFAQKVDPYVVGKTSSAEAPVSFNLTIVLRRDTLKSLGIGNSSSLGGRLHVPDVVNLGFSEKASYLRDRGGVSLNSR